MPHTPVFHHVTGEWRARWRGRIHGGAVLVALPAGVVLTLLASGPLATTATAIYSASLVALFGTSAAYHLFARSQRVQRVMQRLDHCMVYVLIAGTYTPVCLLALPRTLGVTLLSVVWGLAVIGMVLKAMWRARKFATSLYIVLGWIVMAVIPWVYQHAGATALSLYAVGGVVFTAGAVMFMRRYPRLRPEVFGFHEVWHVMTVTAVVLQFTATALLLR
ncbi:MAG: PAQR family membrane homeostasis protein TrhA [Ilumatobacteraceae bacterium]